MRPFQLLSVLLPASLALASEYEQIVLGNAKANVNGWIDDAKKAILDGKQELEKWIHDGKEFIKQDGLMCTYKIFINQPTID
jgi:cathepsin A (carboxypeptidase C)